MSLSSGEMNLRPETVSYFFRELIKRHMEVDDEALDSSIPGFNDLMVEERNVVERLPWFAKARADCLRCSSGRVYYLALLMAVATGDQLPLCMCLLNTEQTLGLRPGRLSGMGGV
jgi:hypothetical protein